MKAIAYTHGLPAADPKSMQDIELPTPVPCPRDLLVKVRAISVNPVDTKVRRGAPTEASRTAPRVLGWDALGIVEAVGDDVTLFKVGDRVFYAGAIDRSGTNAEYQLVDERIVGHAPKRLDDAQAAALPLTSITAWELLFERLGVVEGGGEGDALLIIGAAGGVGSILTQIARKLTRLTVIGTASRDETKSWVRELGAHHVIDHGKPFAAQLRELGIQQVRYVASLTHTDKHYAQIVDALAPQGKLAVIDDHESFDAMPLKRKSISLHWEMMFTRSLFQTSDMIRQHELLDRIAQLVDAGEIRSTLGAHFGKISAQNLRRAHALVESNTARGKIVLEGF